jgi:F-type H+-transporting ATPase subunit delta
MNTGSIAIRYCRALFEEARLAQTDNDIYRAFGTLQQSMKDTPDIQGVLVSPRIAKERKIKLLLTASQCSLPLWERFLQLVIDHQRESLLRIMIYVYHDIFREQHQIDHVIFATATPADDATLKRVVAKVNSRTGRKVELETLVRPELIGGFCLLIGDKLFDYSYRTKLQNIRKQLWNKSR